jgi:hypothetical protein
MNGAYRRLAKLVDQRAFKNMQDSKSTKPTARDVKGLFADASMQVLMKCSKWMQH